MMKKLSLSTVLVILSIAVQSQIFNKKPDIDLTGCWAFLNENSSYSEAYIDKNSIVFLLDMIEKSGPYSYDIINDTLYFSSFKYKIKYQSCDSLFLSYNSTVYLLTKINIGRSLDTTSFDPIYLRRCNFLVNNGVISMDDAIEYLNSLQLNDSMKEEVILKNK